MRDPGAHLRASSRRRCEAHHAASPMPRGHVTRGRLDVIDTYSPCHQRLQVKPASAGQLGEHRDVARGAARAVDAAADRLAVSHQRECIERDCFLDLGSAHQRDRAAALTRVGTSQSCSPPSAPACGAFLEPALDARCERVLFAGLAWERAVFVAFGFAAAPSLGAVFDSGSCAAASMT